MKTYIALLFLVFTYSISAQKHDNTWVLGYQSYVNVEGVGGTRIEFTDIQNLDIFYEYRDMDFMTTNASFSDENGELLFYTNGIYLANSNHDTISNSYGMNSGPSFNNYKIDGYNLPQGAIILDHPDHPEEFFIFHLESITDFDNLETWSPKFQYSHLDMNANNGAGLVIEKNIILNEGTLANGGTHAVRHANGRDWWIINADKDNNRYFLFLLTPQGVSLHSTQEVGPSVIDGLGQFVFSPDGTKFVRYEGHDINGSHYLQFYNFDRCTGELEFITQTFNTHFALALGVAVSPNSRFVYCSSFEFIFQYDLWADDIPASKLTLAQYDGFTAWGLPTYFYQSQLAPDGKIYISSQSTNNILHVIHQPDNLGDAAQVEQHGIILPTINRFTIPNNPNYRLGPIDGSTCDTLGIDNLPLCDFRHRNDILNDKNIEFTDVSFYAPTDWYWTFGDGETSTEIHTTHEYESSGTYEVCLTVSNENGSNSKCRILQIMSTATAEIYAQSDITSQPNPAQDFVYLQMQRSLPDGSVWQLHSATGQIVQQQRLSNDRSELRIDLEELTAGVYFQAIEHNGKVLWRDRVVVAK